MSGRLRHGQPMEGFNRSERDQQLNARTGRLVVTHWQVTHFSFTGLYDGVAPRVHAGVETTYIILLHNFKDQLQEHVRTHAMEAVLSCWELEQAFIALTGMPLGEGSGATMSDEEEEKMGEPGLSLYSPEFFSGHEHLGLGPLIPTESERSLLERVRQELKSELKQDYKNKIADVREEILRKRRAGKLPTETTAILKKWWNAHSKWPYPTEDEKARLVQETGLELKQINNWFINQRKRNWHSHSTTTSSTSLHIDHSSLGGGSGQASNVSLTVSSDTEKRPGDLHDADF